MISQQLWIKCSEITDGLKNLIEYIYISKDFINDYVNKEKKIAEDLTYDLYKEKNEITEFDIEDLSRDYFRISSFPIILYQTILYEAISFFEVNLYSLCKMINDLNKEEEEHEKIMRTIKFKNKEKVNEANKEKYKSRKLDERIHYEQLIDMINEIIDPKQIECLWERYKFFKSIRNHLYHNGEKEIDGNVKKYKKIIEGSKKVCGNYLENIDDQMYRLVITDELCIELLKLQREIFEKVLRAIGKEYYSNSQLGQRFCEEARYFSILKEEFKKYEIIYG